MRYRFELGLGVFPVIDKKPQIRFWQRGGLRAEDSIKKIFGRHRDEATVGVTTGQQIEGGYLYVLDVDERNGGVEALASLPQLPQTVTARTSGGFHYWFKTPSPQPSAYHKNNLEMKGTGCYVVLPPAPGRHWIRNPFEFKVAVCPDFLLPHVEAGVENSEPLTFNVNECTGEIQLDLSNPIARIRNAPVGDRHRTILSEAGRVKRYVLQGRISKDEAREKLLAASLITGLSEDEALRVIDYSLNRGIGGSASTKVVTRRVSPRDLHVLRCVNNHFRALARYQNLDVDKVSSDILSARYVAGLAELRHPPQAQRCMDNLVRVGLLWKNPVPKRLRTGYRPCSRYRPTWAGLSLGSHESPSSAADNALAG